MARRTRKIIVLIAASADGFVARGDGSVDWLDRPQPKGNYGMGEFYRSIDTILWGRKTYEQALAFQAAGVAGAGFDKTVKNYLFSRTRRTTAPGVEWVDEPVSAFIARVRAAPGKNVWMMGGGGLIASFLDEGGIDEFIVHVIPTFIGEGIPLLAPRRRTVSLKLVEAKPFPDGVVRLHYRVR